MNQFFYQDYLIKDMPLTEREEPAVNLRYISIDDFPFPLAGPFPVEPFVQVSMSKLMEMTDQGAWDKLFDEIRDVNTTYLIDDMTVKNEESSLFKNFWLKVYYWNLGKHCTTCYICTVHS